MAIQHLSAASGCPKIHQFHHAFTMSPVSSEAWEHAGRGCELGKITTFLRGKNTTSTWAVASTVKFPQGVLYMPMQKCAGVRLEHLVFLINGCGDYQYLIIMRHRPQNKRIKTLSKK